MSAGGGGLLYGLGLVLLALWTALTIAWFVTPENMPRELRDRVCTAPRE